MTTDGNLLTLACSRINDLAVPAYVKDSELQYVAVNEAYARFFGMGIEDFPGRKLKEIWDRPEDESCEERERRTVVFGEDQEALCFDPFSPARYRVLLEQFETVDGDVYVFAMFDSEILLNTLPVYSPAVAENDLAPPALYRALVETTATAVFVRDSDHRMVLVNDAFLNMRETTAEALLGKDEIEGFGPERGRSYRADNRQVLETGVTTRFEELIKRTDGSEMVIAANTRRVETPDGSRYVVGALNEITPHKRRELELELAKAKAEALSLHLETLLEALPVGILILDAEFVIEYVNDTFHEMWQVDRPFAMAGRTYREFLEYSLNLGLHTGEHLTIDALYAHRMGLLKRSEAAASWELVSPTGRVIAVNSKRLETGKYLIAYSDITAVRQREQETSLYRAALEQMPVPVFLRDDKHKLIFVNAAYEKMLGDKRQRFLGKTQDDMFPEVAKRFQEENAAILEDGTPIEKNEEIKFEDGRRVPVITRLERIETVDGNRFIVGSITDISVLKARELQLIATQERAERLSAYLDGILRSMPVGVMILGNDRSIEFANAKVAEIWEWPTNEALEGHSFDRFEQLRREQGWAWWSELDFESEGGQRLEELRPSVDTADEDLKPSDGKMVVVTCQAIIDGRVLLTYSDITDVRQREQEISEARARLSELAQIMRDAFSVMSQGLVVVEEGTIKLANEAFVRILELPAEMVAPGQLWRGCFEYCAARGDFGVDPSAILQRWMTHIEELRPFSAVFLANGKTWVQFEATVSGHGHWTVACTDITEMKQRETELKALLARSETADRAKSEFLANMSHEIRTPMNGVLGMAELLSKSVLDTRQKTFVDIIVKSGNALLTIINDILDFSKIDAGQLMLRQAPFDPVEAIEDVATLLSTSAAEKDIELIVRGDATMRHMVVGDAGRFRQIVTNLVGNAVKFTEKGHVLIELHAEPGAEGEIMASIRIEDTGIGIPEAKQAAIFEKFSQVDASSTRRHEGTGLGLAITAGLVDLFGGRIEVESVVGRGSVFTVYLPFAVARERQRVNPVPFNVQDARVLVIDDNAINRQILTEQLNSWGFDGLAVENGRYALAILDEAHQRGLAIDALVIDYQMPDMNGMDVARLIRSDQRFDDIAIIFLTSMDMVGDDRIFRQLNVQAHLMKPARANLLRSSIVDVVRASRLKRSAERLVLTAPVEPDDVPDFVPPVLPVVAGAAHPNRILVAEDNEVNQIVFTQILHGMGLEFVIVANGQEVVQAWRELDPALILMDVSMPIMNGHQATQAIREVEANDGAGRHVPIIGVTAHALDSDRDLCLAVGMDDYMSKPISPELLEQKIQRWLGDRLERQNTVAV